MKKARHFVYELLRPDGRVFYVGKGTSLGRIGAHVWEAKRGGAAHKHNVIRKILAAGEEVQHRIVFWTNDEAEAFAEERGRIAEYGRANLCNQTDGGEGCSSPSEETRRKLSAASKGNQHRLGSTDSAETRRKKRDAHMGIPRSVEARQAIAKGQTGNQNPRGTVRSDEVRQRLREAGLRREWDPAWSRKSGEARKGRTTSPEHRAKIAESLRRAYAEGRRKRKGDDATA